MNNCRLIIAIYLALTTSLVSDRARADSAATTVVFDHVTVIDTRGGHSQEDMTVTVANGHIKDVHKSSVNSWGPNVRVIDGRGKYLIPGLWDMEVHLSWTRESALSVLVSNGVTEVRDLGSDPFEIERWKTQIAAGLIVGPHILQVGPMLNGKSFNRYQFAVTSPTETQTTVRLLKFMGVDGLEIERRFPRSSYFALLNEATLAGLPVWGHIPIEVSPEEVSNAGQATIEDVETLFYGTMATGKTIEQQPQVMQRFLESDQPERLFRIFVRNHTAFTPAIAMLQWTVQRNSPGAPPDPQSRYVARSNRDAMTRHAVNEEDRLINREIPFLMQTVERMHKSGVMLLAGTDIAADRVPGFSLLNEVEQLAELGLSPLEAIQTATLNPAIALKKQSEFGSIEPGKVADLVLLNADPLADIRNIEKISAVMIDGKVMDRRDLDLLLKHAESLAAVE